MNENYNTNNYAPNPQYPYPAYQKKKNYTVPILIVIICIAVAAIFLMMSLSGGKSIDMEDYVTVSYNGTDGTATVDVDYDGMCEQLLTKERRQQMEYITGSQDVIKSAAKYMDGSWELIQAMNYTVEPDSGLSNGDKVTVTFTADKDTLSDLGVKMKHPTLTFTVSGLS